MKILAVCGEGTGTSELLRANLEKVLAELEIDAKVSAESIAVANTEASKAQLIFATPEVMEKLTASSAQIIEVQDVFDFEELEFKVQAALG